MWLEIMFAYRYLGTSDTYVCTLHIFYDYIRLVSNRRCYVLIPQDLTLAWTLDVR